VTSTPEHPVTDAELATIWLRRIGQPIETDFWAWEMVYDLVDADPERGWSLVTLLVAGASGANLGQVGAGPLEKLVCQHPLAVIDRVESCARHDPKFRECLSTIWLSRGEVPDEVITRIVEVTGGHVSLLPSLEDGPRDGELV
jgi:hypothetical protein